MYAPVGSPDDGITAGAKICGGVAIIYDVNGNYLSDEYDTLQDAIDDAKSGETVQMADNIQENITIASDDNITLDLNGYVLQGDGVEPTEDSPDHSVIYNQGTLTLKDSNTNNKAYFIYNKDSAWTYIAEPSAAQKASAVDYAVDMDRSKLTSVIAVTGGCITGGTGYGNVDAGKLLYIDGGGIFNDGTLNMAGGNIVGNSAYNRGGGIYNVGTLNITDGNIIGCSTTRAAGGIGMDTGVGLAYNCIIGKIRLSPGILSGKRRTILN